MTNPALEQLKDIHLPQPVHWWPPAPGWWIVAIMLFMLVLFLSRYLLNRYRRQYFYSETRDLLKQNWTRYQQQTLSDAKSKHSPDREFIESTLALIRRAGKTSQAALDDKTGKYLESTPTPALLEALNQNSDGRLSTIIPLEDISQRLYREDGKVLTSEQLQCFYEVARKWLKSTDFKYTTRKEGAKC